jgi:phage terminase small subunit
MALTAQQQLFVAEYPLDFNATQAAIRAGYSKKSAYSQGQRLLKHVEIQSALAEATQQRQARLDKRLKDRHMTADEWLAEATKLARGSLRPLLHITADGDPYIDLSKADDDTLDALSAAEIEDFTDGRERDADGEVVRRDVKRVKIKMHDKVAALGLVGKHLGLLVERVKVEDADQLAEAMVSAMRKAERTGT